MHFGGNICGFRSVILVVFVVKFWWLWIRNFCVVALKFVRCGCQILVFLAGKFRRCGSQILVDVALKYCRCGS